MARYYFDTVIDNEFVDDPHGIEMASVQAVEDEVRITLIDIVRESVHGLPVDHVAVSVRDDDGPVMEGSYDRKVAIFPK